MFCGKTLELVRHLQIFREQQIPLICLRPTTDVRTPKVQSKSGLLLDATSLDPNSLEEIANTMKDKSVIGIDEIQFFPAALAPILEEEMRRGKTILLAGLDTDFSGKVFPLPQAIMAIPETNIQRSRSVCGICHRYNATRTQRLRDGNPVRADESNVLVEGTESSVTYEARCVEHHIVL